jgi:hypothetical protein
VRGERRGGMREEGRDERRGGMREEAGWERRVTRWAYY